MEVHIDLGNVSQMVNDNQIRSRIRNIRRFLNLADVRLHRLQVIKKISINYWSMILVVLS